MAVKKVLLAQDVAETGKQLLREHGYEIVVAPDEKKETLKTLIADCDAVFSKTCFLDEEVLSAGKKLKVVAKHGAGVDNVVDVETASKLGLYVVYTPLANMDSVAEHTMALILSLSKNLLKLDDATRHGDFDAPLRIESNDLVGKTLGLIGLGNIGRRVAKSAYLGFGIKVIAYDPYLKETPDYVEIVENIDDIFSRSDYVSIHVGATPETKGLVNKERLSLMKRSAYLLNVARGSIVVEEDLIWALNSHIIRGAALDVYEQEPVDTNDPLLTLDNVVLTPHSAALTKEAMDRMSYQGCQGIVEILEGKTPTWCKNYLEIRP